MSVLFARLGALGDFVLTLPVLRALGPGVDVLCEPRFEVLLPAGTRRVDWDWRRPLDYARAFAFSPSMAEALKAAGVREVRHVAPRPPPGVHATAWFATVLDHAIDLVPRIDVEPVGADCPVVIAPGSGGMEKRWPMERWREVAACLGDVPVRWIGGPVEDDLPFEKPDLMGLAALAAACGAFCAPDSGPGHLAASAGAPVLSVFGPTDPRCWAPAGARVFAWDAEPASLAAAARSARLTRLLAAQGALPR